MQGTGSPQDPLRTLKFYDLFQNVPNLAKLCFFGGLKITFNYLKSFLALQKSTAMPGWAHFETNPKILESLEGPEGYLCPGIHISGIVSVYGKPFTPQAFSEILA